MKSISLLLAFLLALNFWSCKEEKFQPYNDIEDIAVVSPQDTTIVRAQLQNLSISPQLKGLQADKQYTYQWRLYVGESYKILATTQDLNIKIDFAVDDYSIQFLVTDPTTGIKAISQLYALKVTGAFPEGWLVGNNLNGKGQMSFIRTADQQVYINPLEEVNGGIYPEKVIAAVSGVVPSAFFGTFSQLFYFTENGLRVFDAETMLQTMDLNEYFYGNKSFSKIPAYGTNAYNLDQYLIYNGELYAANGLSFGQNTDFGKFSERFEGDYSMFPFVFADAAFTTYFYDNKNKRFMSANYQGRELTVPSRVTTNGQYNINNIQRTMIGSDFTLGNNYLSLMTDEKQAYIYAFRLSSDDNIPDGYYTSLAGAKELDQYTGFAAASDVERAYYSSKNKIYKISAANGSVTELFSLPNGAEIVDLKMLKAGDDANRQLVFAVNKGTSGEVHCIFLNEFGDIDSSRKEIVYTGFGQITNISYRKAS
ncbi:MULTISPECIES: PKD-like family lipoprotein [Sphingobacterium]|uniref:PKD-like family lipoprotein n=1 Tax=Sphingobacterium TaxID=28453 RepID=UPI00257D8EC0|nr:MULTISPECIES: PKD-like family lipoprotein [Sphingobacterium]